MGFCFIAGTGGFGGDLPLPKEVHEDASQIYQNLGLSLTVAEISIRQLAQSLLVHPRLAIETGIPNQIFTDSVKDFRR